MTFRLSKYALASTLALTSIAQADVTVLINEIDSDQTSTDTAEFIELFNGGNGSTALDDYVLVFYNGSNDLSYQAFDLDGYNTNADGYFVLCSDAANVANCDFDVSPDSNLLQNGADAVALYLGSAADFTTGTAVATTGLIDAIVYDTADADDAGLLVLLNTDEPQVDESANSDSAGQSLQRCDNGSGGARNTSTFIAASPTPGITNSCSAPITVSLGSCGDEATLISAVQGSIFALANDISPLNGEQVIVEGIVTLDKQGGLLANGDSSYQYSGFWLQEEDNDNDGDSNTSEGIFVYDYGDAVNEGDLVRLVASVSEYQKVTQLKNVTDINVCSSNNVLPTATTMTMPVTSLLNWEALEGMRVSINQNLLVSDLFGTGYGFGNYGQFVASSELHFQSTEIAAPESEEAAAAIEAKLLDSLLIDDGVSASYPAFIPFPDDTGFSADNPMRIGYTIPAASGVITAYNDNYILVPSAITIDPTLARTLAPQIAEDANLVIVSMNVLNYFNGDGEGGGFPTSRGAKTAAAFAMQSDKIVAALTAMNADIISLMEIENDGYSATSAIQTLVNELNAQQSAGNEYRFIDPGLSSLGTDAISVGLLYRAEKVTPVGTTAILTTANSPLDGDGVALFDDSKNRPSLNQSFSFNDHIFTISANHLKSKGSACGETDEGADGQGNCNINRTRAAQALTEYLAGNPTKVNSDSVILLGDLNAYSKEDPITTLLGADFVNLKYSDQSTEKQPFSYSYGGYLGSLDHALAKGSITDAIVSVDAWHINSVEDSLMDYETEANGQSFSSVDNYANADAYRSSDHDPIVIGLNLLATEVTDPDDTEVDNESDAGVDDGVDTEVIDEAEQAPENNNATTEEKTNAKGGSVMPWGIGLLLMLLTTGRRQRFKIIK